jgi:hypothetical protein
MQLQQLKVSRDWECRIWRPELMSFPPEVQEADDGAMASGEIMDGHAIEVPKNYAHKGNENERGTLMGHGTVIELHVPDFDPIREYYGRLGFVVVWEREPEGSKGYLVMKMGSNVLCFWAGNENAYQRGFLKNSRVTHRAGTALRSLL